MGLIKTPSVGEILAKEYMSPLNLSAYKLANDINVPVSRIQDIIHGRRKITIDTSLRLDKYFGMSEGFFLRIQQDIDLREAKLSIIDQLDNIQTVTLT